MPRYPLQPDREWGFGRAIRSGRMKILPGPIEYCGEAASQRFHRHPGWIREGSVHHRAMWPSGPQGFHQRYRGRGRPERAGQFHRLCEKRRSQPRLFEPLAVRSWHQGIRSLQDPCGPGCCLAWELRDIAIQRMRLESFGCTKQDTGRIPQQGTTSERTTWIL